MASKKKTNNGNSKHFDIQHAEFHVGVASEEKKVSELFHSFGNPINKDGYAPDADGICRNGESALTGKFLNPDVRKIIY